MTASLASDPAALSALRARRLIARRELSPVELADACIERIGALDHAVNALVAHDFPSFRSAAKNAEKALMAGGELGVLHGLPFGVKDMIDVAGLPTTFGSKIFRDNIPSKDDRLVAAMRRSGAIPIGKTNNPEWSAGGNTRNRVYGVTANPYDLNRTCAGSSGGSAVSLACGYAPLATGSDTGGSLRNPAAYCGVVGLRPSPGVVPGPNRDCALIPLQTAGPMARNVADVALMLSAIARTDYDDPFSIVSQRNAGSGSRDYATLPSYDLLSLKVAVTEDYGFAPTENIVRNHFRTVIRNLEPFIGTMTEASPDCTGADRIFAVLRALQFLGKHARLVDGRPSEVGPLVTANVEEGRTYSAEDVADALIMQGRYYRDWQAFFSHYDVLLCPTVTVSPRPWRELYPAEIDGIATKSYYHWLSMAYASTIAGHPSISIPCGRDANNMPFGLQIVGRRHGDHALLAVAAEIEGIIASSSDLAPRSPDLEMLKSAPPIAASREFRTLS